MGSLGETGKIVLAAIATLFVVPIFYISKPLWWQNIYVFIFTLIAIWTVIALAVGNKK